MGEEANLRVGGDRGSEGACQAPADVKRDHGVKGHGKVGRMGRGR